MKTIKTLLFTCCLLFAGFSQAQVSDGQLEGKAIAATNDCVNQYRGSNEIIAVVSVVNCVTEPCPVAYSVSIYANPKCPGNQICPARPTIQIATVDFDASANILSTSTICQ